MKKLSVFGLVLLLGLGLATCANKKKQNVSEETPANKAPHFWKFDKKKKLEIGEKPMAVNPPALCKFSRIEVKPAVVDNAEVIIKSGKQVSFSATAYDSAGKEAPANFSWAFRGLPQDNKLTGTSWKPMAIKPLSARTERRAGNSGSRSKMKVVWPRTGGTCGARRGCSCIRRLRSRRIAVQSRSCSASGNSLMKPRSVLSVSI